MRASVQGKPVISVFMPVWYDPVITIGKGAFITEIVDAAGGHSVTADLTAEWPHISMETVVERAPDFLLLVRGGKTDTGAAAGQARLEHSAGSETSSRLLR